LPQQEQEQHDEQRYVISYWFKNFENLSRTLYITVSYTVSPLLHL